MYKLIKIEDKLYVISNEGYRNFNYQIEGSKVLTEFKGDELVDTVLSFKIFIQTVKIKHNDNVQEMKGTGFLARATNIKKLKDEQKNFIKNTLNKAGLCMPYCEPESDIISRTGDRCVVALTDQWFINYGEKNLTSRVNNYIDNILQTYDVQVKNMFKKSSDWINEWPCSRQYGLGTKLLDSEYLIDSLSDSTIYMAYYTLSHLITKIPIKYFKDSVWDHLFMGQISPSFPTNIIDTDHIKLIQEMKKEFEYWYPVDIRVSGKDLVPNHLTMSLYNHMAIWGEYQVPRSFLANGHIMLNGEKMSKSTGNFMTLKDALNKFGADATRMALTKTGSSIEDANFTIENGNTAVLKLSTEMVWCKELIDELQTNKQNDGRTIWDDIFTNEINRAINDSYKHYDENEFQKVLNSAFFDILIARDNYRSKYDQGFIKMNNEVMFEFLITITNLIYPICPHWSETIINYANKYGIIINKGFPKINKLDFKTMWFEYCLNNTINNICGTVSQIFKKHCKKQKTFNRNINIIVNLYSFSEVELNIVRNIKKMISENMNKKQIIPSIISQCENKKMKGHYGKFSGYIINMINTYGIEWVDWIQSSTEYNLINKWIPIILDNFTIKKKNDENEIQKLVYVSGFDIHQLVGNDRSQFKFGPGSCLVLVY